MSPDKPENPALEYAHRSSLAPRPKSLLEVTGFHFVAGNGIATLAAVAFLLTRRPYDYPMTTGCGGTFVVVIQAGLLALGAGCRQMFSGRLLDERKTNLTVAAGALGAFLVFGLPFAVSRFSNNEAAYAATTLLMLCVYPLVASAFLFVPSRGGVRRAR
jgi:hypothetical protein